MGYILGIHLGHDATAAIIDEKGHIIAAVAEERLTRIKYHIGFPYRAIEEVLQIAQIKKEDISSVATATLRMFYPGAEKFNQYFFSKDYNYLKKHDLFNKPELANKYLKLGKLIIQNLNPFYRPSITNEEFSNESKKMTRQLIREALDTDGFSHAHLDIVEHHHCHASSAFFTSGLETAMIITMDGAGDGLCASVSIGNGNRIERKSTASSDCSPGRFYSEITRFCGFKRNRHEGKITGLAAYGNADRYYEKLKPYLEFNREKEKFEYIKTVKTNLSSKLSTIQRIMNNENFGNEYINDFHDFLKANFDPKDDMADLAAACQLIAEEAAVEYTSHFLNKYKMSKILLAGGIFANVRINQEIARLEGVDHVFIHQNMGDGGCSVGAAFSVHFEKNGNPYQNDRPKDVYLGRGFTNFEIRKALEQENVGYELVDDIEKHTAKLLYDKKVVARFNGRMEYGPRALGNRSILAAPTDKSINDWLNKRLNRTEFMPFAPSVLDRQADSLFHDYDNRISMYTANFMTITYDVKKEWHDLMQATTHVDGTARPQVVSQSDNLSYYRIIDEYYKLSGIPGIVNTSFNMHEEPIVATPYDAIRAFKSGAFDYLAIGDYICAFKN